MLVGKLHMKMKTDSPVAWMDGNCAECQWPAIACYLDEFPGTITWYCSNVTCTKHYARDKTAASGYPVWRVTVTIGDGEVRDWDKLADSKLPGWEERYGGLQDVERMLGAKRPFGPHRKAGNRCRSGSRPYCTCDTCF